MMLGCMFNSTELALKKAIRGMSLSCFGMLWEPQLRHPRAQVVVQKKMKNLNVELIVRGLCWWL